MFVICHIISQNFQQADHSKELKSTPDAPAGQTYRIYLPVTAIKSKCPKTLKVTCNIGESKIVNTLLPANEDCMPHTSKHSGQGKMCIIYNRGGSSKFLKGGSKPLIKGCSTIFPHYDLNAMSAK